ncbi:MAG: hypothetical protein ABF325_07640 [Lentimonas sp.]
MDNWLEYLGPVILAGIYFFGNKFVKGQEEGEEPNPAQKVSTPQDTEAAERQRRIQEEIRRKIMERRQAAERGETAAPVAARGQASSYDEQFRKRRAAFEVRQQQRETVKEVTPPPVPRQVEPTPVRKIEEVNRGFSWDNSDNAYESQIEQQLQQIEATKRQAAQLKKQAGMISMKSNKPGRSRGSRTFSGPVRSQLKDLAAARAAFIYGEVLGQSVSIRKESGVLGLG